MPFSEKAGLTRGELKKEESGSLALDVEHPKLGKLALRTVEIEKQGDEPGQEAYTGVEVTFLRKPEFTVTYKNKTVQPWEWHLSNNRVLEQWVEDAELVRQNIFNLGKHNPESRMPDLIVSMSFRNGGWEDR